LSDQTVPSEDKKQKETRDGRWQDHRQSKEPIDKGFPVPYFYNPTSCGNPEEKSQHGCNQGDFKRNI
jgi:hypothetical protein